MLNDLLIWVALLVGLAILVIDKRRGVGALVLAYFLNLSISHVPGVLPYLDANIILFSDEVTKVGFEVTLIGMTAFIVGAMAARILRWQTTKVKETSSVEMFSRRSWRLLLIGLVCYFVLLPVSALVPSLTAIISVLGMLFILGFWLRLHVAATARQTFSILAMLPLLPLATLVTGGFIGFGTSWALSVVAFQFVIARRRIWFYLAAPLVIFLGLSLFVTYFAQRADIRRVTWDERTSIMQRPDTVSRLVTDFQLLDLSNQQHLFALDQRLNQNSLVGMGVLRHRAGAELWYGATIPLWVLIPRALWPDKPTVGGGQDFVSQFTGLTFAQGTSVGLGQVLEFYMNFGMPGVLIGFAVLGFILMRIDQGVRRSLVMRDMSGVVLWALPGLALLQPGGNGMEILVALASAIVASRFLVHSKLLRSSAIRQPGAKMSGPTAPVILR